MFEKHWTSDSTLLFSARLCVGTGWALVLLVLPALPPPGTAFQLAGGLVTGTAELLSPCGLSSGIAWVSYISGVKS